MKIILLSIGALGIGYALGRYSVRRKSGNSQKTGQQPPVNESPTEQQPSVSEPAIDLAVAQDVFIKNLSKFTPLFPSLIDGTYTADTWIDLVIDINDDNLINLWKKVCPKSEFVIRLLSSWGIRHDSCTNFVATPNFSSMYTTSEGTTIKENIKYNVIVPCWLQTIDNEKKVILKGKAHESNQSI